MMANWTFGQGARLASQKCTMSLETGGLCPVHSGVESGAGRPPFM